mmetsp:Transcript_19076/g.46095  ORF Transcript_19076/g.46095 Transcript_19076/m.46095 type:complete len:794 (-) Transcript_19076:89-2470(-)
MVSSCDDGVVVVGETIGTAADLYQYRFQRFQQRRRKQQQDTIRTRQRKRKRTRERRLGVRLGLRFFQVHDEDGSGCKEEEEEAKQFDDGCERHCHRRERCAIPVVDLWTLLSPSITSSSSSSGTFPRIPPLIVVVLFCIVLNSTTSTTTTTLPPLAVVSASFVVPKHQHRHRHQQLQKKKLGQRQQYIMQQQQFCATSADRNNDEPSFSWSSSLLSSSFRSKTENNNNNNISSDENRIHYLPDVERVWVLSDLHTDHVQNLQWVRDRMMINDDIGGDGSDNSDISHPTRHVFSSKDLLVIAGDISHDLELLEETFRVLLRQQPQQQEEENVDETDKPNSNNIDSPRVLFCSGNHEAWLSGPDLKKETKSTTKNVKHTKDPGFHGDDDDTTTTINSLNKLDQVYDICNKFGVLTGCTCVGGGPPGATTTTKDDDANNISNPLWVVPLESWYDGSLNIPECEDLTQDFGKWPWVDFIKCRWPTSSFPENPVRLWRKIPYGLVEFLLELNRRTVLKNFQEAFVRQQEQQQQSRKEEDDDESNNNNNNNPSVGVMTVSHFLPNRQCLPDWKDVSSDNFDRSQWLDHGGGGISAKFALVAGTDRLDEQIRNEVLPPPSSVEDASYDNVRQIHVFGHSHRPKDFELNNIRYIHNPLGKPREREIYMVNPNVDFQLVWETSSSKTTAATTQRGGEVPGETVVRYWEEHGGGVEMLRKRMKKTRRRTRYGFKHSHSHSKPDSTSKSEPGSQSDPKNTSSSRDSSTTTSGSSESKAESESESESASASKQSSSPVSSKSAAQ